MGGFTQVTGKGGYYLSEDKVVIKEPVAKVTSFAEQDAFFEKRKELLKWIKEKQVEWGQDSIGFEFEGDMYYFDQRTKKQKEQMKKEREKKN